MTLTTEHFTALAELSGRLAQARDGMEAARRQLDEAEAAAREHVAALPEGDRYHAAVMLGLREARRRPSPPSVEGKAAVRVPRNRPLPQAAE